MYQYFVFTLLWFILRSTNSQIPSCTCVAKNSCYQNMTPVDVGGIDIRIVNPTDFTTAMPVPPPTLTPGICQAGYDLCCSGLTGCGLRYNVPVQPPVVPGPGQSRYGSQPWQAVILAADGGGYIGGGALLDPKNVLTAAHKVAGKAPSSIRVRLGDWNATATNEPFNYSERAVNAIIVHPLFNSTNLYNDIAILKLAAPVIYNPVINNICLPAPNLIFDNNRCLVAGWGKDAFTGALQNVQKEVDVPFIAQSACQSALRTTRLGASFNLDPSFVCAGGEAGKDACTGDGGAALSCSIGGKYFLAGLVAWGIGCATSTIPGVYVNVQMFTPWILNNTNS